MTRPESIFYRVAALLSPGATVIGLATLAVSDGGSRITTPEIVMAIVATVTAGAAHASVQALPEVASRGPRTPASDLGSTDA